MKTQKTNNRKADQTARNNQASKNNTKKKISKSKSSRKYHFEHGNYC